MIYTLKVRQPGQWFFRKYRLKGQVAQSERLILELVDGTFRDLPQLSLCEFKFGQDLIESRKAAQKRNEDKANDVPGPQA